ncbi:Wzz/FepE/Etk N-terminal domain-containing protein [Dyadobacter sp. CY347]|uniref:Wzz/FepE/Etk N-terminal domain-containing protein n=1 Tax=Dyadobacter sp. CY347 TaxID=2909336 RepID=UPI001F1D9349|nr:Wzz/FepE/Etk N-terminal domain-containing protein [Dyadobacter sp. CY347]MCF2491087.1 Wzz/FepE/Etk N-terminal domain-containing protein [Dyadobacter sp. CY347]
MSDQITNTENKSQQVLEIRLVDVFIFLKKYIKILLIIGVVCGIAGIVLSFFVTKTYESKITLLPEYGLKSNSFSLLGAGLNSDGAEKLSPELYPSILQSSPFGEYLLQQPVVDQDNVKYKNLETYLRKDSSVSFVSRIFSFFRPSKSGTTTKVAPKLPADIVSRTVGEQSLVNQATSIISASADPKEGIITISAETEDPYVSAVLVREAKNYMEVYVEDYRTTKAKQKVDLLKEQVAEAKKRMSDSEYALNSYRDRNRNAFLNVARIEEQRLQADYVLAQSLYSSLVSRYEQARISVKEEKPVFKILEPAKVPLSKSGPKRLKYGIFTAIFGVVIGLMYILFVREKIQDNLIPATSL